MVWMVCHLILSVNSANLDLCVAGQADQIGARSLDGSAIKVKMKCTLLLRGPISTSLFHCGLDGLSPNSERKFGEFGPLRCWPSGPNRGQVA